MAQLEVKSQGSNAKKQVVGRAYLTTVTVPVDS